MAIETVTVSRNDGVSELLPDVALAPDGKLVCIYRESDTDFVRNYSGVAVRTSIDGGHTWSERRPIVESRSDAAEEVQKWNRPHVQVLEDGRMLALCDVFPAVPGEDTDHTNSHTVFWWSDDQGETWSEPEHTDVIGLVPDRVIELPSGAWLLATCVRMKEGSYDRQGRTVQIAHRSENRGNTWEGPYVIGQHDRYHLSEGSVLLLPDGELVCYIREDTGLGVAAFKSFSNDEGRTWDGLYTSPLDGCHAPTARLLPSGKVLVTYRYQQGGSTGTYRSTPADWHKEYPPARAGGPTSYWARNTFAYLESVESAKARDLDQQGGVVLPLDHDRSHRPHSGYTGTVVLHTGKIFCVNYVVDDAPEAQIRGYWFDEDDFYIV